MTTCKSTRERILDAAYLILSEENLSQLSIDRVSERAGLSRRTFFLHFSSKDELLAELAVTMRPVEADRYRSWIESLDPEASAEERISTFFHRMIAETSDPGWKGCCFLRLSSEFGGLPGHPVHAVVAAAYRDMERWFETELQRDGYASPGLVARHLLVTAKGLLVAQLVHRSPRYGEAVLTLIPVLLAHARLNGLRAPQSGLQVAVPRSRQVPSSIESHHEDHANSNAS